MIEHPLLASEHRLMNFGVLGAAAVLKASTLGGCRTPQRAIHIEGIRREQVLSERLHGSFLFTSLDGSQWLTALGLTHDSAININTANPPRNHTRANTPQANNQCGAVNGLLIRLARLRRPVRHFI